MKKEFFSVVLFIFLVGFVSAGFFDDIFGGITGNVVLEEEDFLYENFTCEDSKEVFDNEYINYEIPGAIPFSDDVFDVYVDDKFILSFELVDKKITSLECEVSDEVSYRVYISSDLIDEVILDAPDDVVGFYNEKRESGELEIKAVGFFNKLKIGFINFGLKIAGWFS